MPPHLSAERAQIQAASTCVWRGPKILLVQRLEPPQAWAFPGGKLWPGESPEQAALRELYEETGITAKLTGIIGQYTLHLPRETMHITCFAALWIEGQAKAADDALNARWFSIAESLELPLAPLMREALLKAGRIAHLSTPVNLPLRRD